MPIWSAEIKELEKLYESFQGKLPALEKELEPLIKTDDANVIMLYSRRTLEIIITDLCECELKRSRGTEPLKGIIDKLHKERKVPDHISTSMHGLNDLSTYGTHPKDFDPAQVKPVLNNLDIIIKWYLKYMDVRIDIISKPDEEISEDIRSTAYIKKSTKIQKKRFIGLISGLILLVVVAVLFLTNIIGGGKQAKELDKSIAVLPFKLLSDEPDKQYLADGMMEEITMHLSKIKDLRIIAGTLVEQYRNPTKTTASIGRELGVGYLLEGSFQKFGDNVKLIVKLIKTGKKGRVWANDYDRNWKDVFSVQSEVAQTVAAELYASISQEEKNLIEKVPTSDTAAYVLYLRAKDYARDYQETHDLSAYQTSVNLFNEALLIDPAFAKAYTGLAQAYYDRYYWPDFFKENFLDSCLALVNIALKIDNQLDEAYYIKGEYYEQNGHIDEALENYDKALKINPNYYAAYERKGWVLTSVKNDYINGIENYNNALKRISGKERASLLRDLAFAYKDIGFFEKARYYYNEAFTLDSNKIVDLNHLLILAAVEEKFDEAKEITKKLQKIDTTYIPRGDYIVIGLTTGDVEKEEADAYAKKIIEFYNKSGEPNLQESHRVGFILSRVGKMEEARKYLDQQIKYCEESIKLDRNLAQWKAAYYDLAITYAFLGNKEKAYKYLDELIKGNTCQIRWITYLKYDPLLENIRNEEPFQKILHNYEAKYQAEHERVRKWLEEQGML